jgi:hypothetical protein
LGRAIISGVAVVLVVAIIAIVVVYFRRRQSKDDAQMYGWATKGDLNRAQERQLLVKEHAAAEIFSDMLHPTNLREDLTILSDAHRRKIENWLQAKVKEGN